MGVRCFGSNGSSYLTDTRNPNPNIFKIVKSGAIGDYIVAKIQYPGCILIHISQKLVTCLQDLNQLSVDGMLRLLYVLHPQRRLNDYCK